MLKLPHHLFAPSRLHPYKLGILAGQHHRPIPPPPDLLQDLPDLPPPSCCCSPLQPDDHYPFCSNFHSDVLHRGRHLLRDGSQCRLGCNPPHNFPRRPAPSQFLHQLPQPPRQMLLQQPQPLLRFPRQLQGQLLRPLLYPLTRYHGTAPAFSAQLSARCRPASVQQLTRLLWPETFLQQNCLSRARVKISLHIRVSVPALFVAHHEVTQRGRHQAGSRGIPFHHCNHRIRETPQCLIQLLLHRLVVLLSSSPPKTTLHSSQLQDLDRLLLLHPRQRPPQVRH